MHSSKFNVGHVSILLTVIIINYNAECAYSTQILDQFFKPNYINHWSDIGYTDKAQTFTVGIKGMLTRVDVLIRRFPDTNADLLFDVRTTSAGVPIESDTLTLASVMVPPETVPTTEGFLSFDLSSYGVSVEIGDVLAIVLRSSGVRMQEYRWSGSWSEPLYPGGQQFYRNPKYGINTWALIDAKDLGFRTFVDPIPEPVIEAEIDIDPKTLNLRSKGKWISCYMWLPEEYDVADVNFDSVFLKFGEDEIGAEWIWFDEEEQLVMVQFNRSEVQDILEVGEVELTVTGELADGTRFQGVDIIRAIDKRLH